MEYNINDIRLAEYLNTTRTLDNTNPTNQITSYHSELRPVAEKLKSMEDNLNPELVNKLPKITSMDDMLTEAIKILRSINSEFGERAERVLNSDVISKNICFSSENHNTSFSKVLPHGRVITKIEISKDARGLMTLAQELMNVSVYAEHSDKKNEADKKKTSFIAKTAKMFVGSCVIDYILKNFNNPPYTAEQIDILKTQLFREFSHDSASLDVDQELMSRIYDENPEIFQHNVENYSPEDFAELLSRFKGNASNMEKINERVKDIAETGKTPNYLMDSCVASLAGLELHEQFLLNGNPVAVKLLEGIQTNQTILEQNPSLTNKTLLENAPTLVRREVERREVQSLQENEMENEMVMERVRSIPTNNNIVMPK